MRIFYGTNRARESACSASPQVRWNSAEGCRPNVYYTGLPADVADGREGLELGTFSVTFPPRHEAGKLERPSKVLQVLSVSLSQEDPDKHVLISELRSFGADETGWARELAGAGRDQAFIYVHGFETTFDEAARRAAQLAFDLDFDVDDDFRGVPMLFSWPSRGNLDSYGTDYDTAEDSTDAFNRFLDVIKERAGIRRVHVIAHSMGNRVVAEALYERRQQGRPVVDQLVLAAPDIWARRFKNRLLQTLPKLASRVTLYVSDQDRALIAARKIRDDEPRAGQVAGGLLSASHGVERFDAIDATSLRRDFLGHSYYASSGSMLGDIYCLLKGAPVTTRPLLMVADVAWRFRPANELALWRGHACAPLVPAVRSAELPQPSRWPKLVGAGAAVVGLALLGAIAVARRRRA